MRLLDAAVAEVTASGFDRLTVRLVATRAGVATATAYDYFGSKEHMLTEVFYRRLTAVPVPVMDEHMTLVERVQAVMGPMALVVADERELGGGVTTSMLSHDPHVEALREQIGALVLARVEDCLAGQCPDAARGLALAFVGALTTAGMGLLAYRDIAPLLRGLASGLMESP